jgi:hypothetical protein
MWRDLFDELHWYDSSGQSAPFEPHLPMKHEKYRVFPIEPFSLREGCVLLIAIIHTLLLLFRQPVSYTKSEPTCYEQTHTQLSLREIRTYPLHQPDQEAGRLWVN